MSARGLQAAPTMTAQLCQQSIKENSKLWTSAILLVHIRAVKKTRKIKPIG
jgi:hypothetical protein